jgi:hypothetical protein
MVMSLPDELRAKRAATERWIARREATLRRGASELEALGRQAYADTIRKGERVMARTPAEIRALGLAAVQGRLPQAIAEGVIRKAAPKVAAVASTVGGLARTAVSPTSSPYQRDQARKQLAEQGRAALSGFADEITFGAADRVLSAGDALIEGSPRDFAGRYSENMATKKAEDAYDQEHYGLARGAGRIAGAGTGIAVLGAPAVARGAVSLIPRGAQFAKALSTSRHALDPRGLTTMATVGGAGAGVASQAAADVVAGRPSSLTDYAGAAAGGAVNGLATLRLGPVAGGAIGGAATTTAQGQLSGRAVSADDVINSGRASGALGGLFGLGGAYWASQLPVAAKGVLGEGLSAVKTMARGDGIPFGFRKRLNLDQGGHTFTDLRFAPRLPGKKIGVVEAKMGPEAKASSRQIQASNQPDIEYVWDGWRFTDVGKAAGAAFSSGGAQYEEQERGRRQSR